MPLDPPVPGALIAAPVIVLLIYFMLRAVIRLCRNPYTVRTDKKSLTRRKGSCKDTDLTPENIQYILGEMNKRFS